MGLQVLGAHCTPSLCESLLARSPVSGLVEIACVLQDGQRLAEIATFAKALLRTGDRTRGRLVAQISPEALSSVWAGCRSGLQSRIQLRLELIDLRRAGSSLAWMDRGRECYRAKKQDTNVNHRVILSALFSPERSAS